MNIRYIWFLEYAATLHIEYEHYFSFTVTLLWLRVTLKVSHPTVLVSIKKLILSLNTKCHHLFTSYSTIVTLVSMHSPQSCAVKNNQTVTYFHTHRLYIFIYRYITHANMNSSIVTLNTESFPSDNFSQRFCF